VDMVITPRICRPGFTYAKLIGKIEYVEKKSAGQDILTGKNLQDKLYSWL
jgi:hypothetical protein